MHGPYARRNIHGLIVLALISLTIISLYAYIKTDRQAGEIRTTNYKRSLAQLSFQQPEPLTVSTLHPTSHGIQSCNLGFINGKHFDKTINVPNGTPMGLGGWVLDNINKTVPPDAWFVMVGPLGGPSYQSKILLRSRATDVQEAFGGNPSYAYAGFIAKIDTTHMSNGTYHIYIVFMSGGNLYTCDNGRHVVIGAKHQSG